MRGCSQSRVSKPEYRSVGIKENSVGDPAFMLVPRDENARSSAVAECKPYRLPRVTDLPKAIKKFYELFFTFFSARIKYQYCYIQKHATFNTLKKSWPDPGRHKTVVRGRKSPRLQPQAIAK